VDQPDLGGFWVGGSPEVPSLTALLPVAVLRPQLILAVRLPLLELLLLLLLVAEAVVVLLGFLDLVRVLGPPGVLDLLLCLLNRLRERSQVLAALGFLLLLVLPVFLLLLLRGDGLGLREGGQEKEGQDERRKVECDEVGCEVSQQARGHRINDLGVLFIHLIDRQGSILEALDRGVCERPAPACQFLAPDPPILARYSSRPRAGQGRMISPTASILDIKSLKSSSSIEASFI